MSDFEKWYNSGSQSERLLIKGIINEHFDKHGPPTCVESLFQCDHYQVNLDVLVAKIMDYLGYFDE